MTQRSGPGDPPSDESHRPAAPAPHVDAHVIDLATPEWCWERLFTTTAGRLSSGLGRQPFSLPVGYSVENGEVLIPIGSTPGAAHLLGGIEVTLGLGGYTPGGLRWVVRATGVALLAVLGEDRLAAARNSHPARRVDLPRPDALLLNVDRVRGYYETPLRLSPGARP